MQPTTSIRCAAAGSPRTTGRIARPPTLWPIGSAARKTARRRTYVAYVCTGRRGPVSFSGPTRIGGPQIERPAVRAICFTILVRQVRIDPLQRVRGRRLRLLRIRAEELCRARGRLQSVALRARLVGDAVEVPDLVRQGVHREDILEDLLRTVRAGENAAVFEVAYVVREPLPGVADRPLQVG